MSFAMFQRHEVRAHDITDVETIARLRAVAEYNGALSGLEEPAEDGDDARLTLRVLSRAVDVRIAEDDRREPILLGIESDNILPEGLGETIWRKRRSGRSFIGGGLLRSALDRTAP